MTQAPQFDALVTDPVFPVTFRAFSEGIYGHGVIGIGGLEATAGTGDFDVDVAAGEVQYNGERFEHGSSDTVTLDAPGTDPRWDVVYFDTATESVGVKKGAAGSTPVPADVGDGEVLLAYIEVLPEASDLTDEDVRNWRARPQPAVNVPLDHADVGGETVHEGLTWVFENTTLSPHGNADHDPNFSEEGHDHSGETLGADAALAQITTLVAEIAQLAASVDADGNDLTGIGQLAATAATVSDAPAAGTDVVRLTELQDLASTVAIETIQVSDRSELPDPTGVSGPVIAYIDDEDRYAGVFQE